MRQEVKEGALGEVELTTDRRLAAGGTAVTSVCVASLDSAPTLVRTFCVIQVMHPLFMLKVLCAQFYLL